MKIKYSVLVAMPDNTTTQVDFECSNFLQIAEGLLRFTLNDEKEVYLNKDRIIQITEETL